MRSQHVWLHLFDPRGRCNRQGLLILAIALLGVQIAAGATLIASGAGLSSAATIVCKVLILWMASAAIAKRLHDLGLSAWWTLKAALGVIAWSTALAVVMLLAMGDAAVEPGGVGFWIAAGGTTLPVFLLILWLHCARGETGPNRFGAEPRGLGFSHPIRHGGMSEASSEPPAGQAC